MGQIIIALGLMALVAWLDYETGDELAFSIFYLAPIALISWFAGRPTGRLFALLGAALWFLAEAMDHKVYSNPAIGYWNAFVRLSFFMIVNFLVGTVRRELNRVRDLSQKDHLTGAVNRRHFQELAEAELARSARYGRPLTLVYIDLDNFKTVNDQLGHEIGDEVLTTVVSTLRENLRKPDVVARIGGDEFLVLMPETSSEQAETVIERILERTRDRMRAQDWPVGMSIGAVTTSEKLEVAELLKRADAQMYRSKRGGKDRAHYE